jgi:prevent-host-death family protein
MDTVTVRDLRNHGGDVLRRVSGGESLIVTRDGAPVAELRPLRRASVSSAELIARRAALPALDAEQFTTDVDSVLDSTV